MHASIRYSPGVLIRPISRWIGAIRSPAGRTTAGHCKLAAVYLTVIGWCALHLTTTAFPQGPRQAARVEVAKIQQRTVSAGQTFVGAVTPSRESVVGSAVDGRVVELYVNDGDEVKLVEDGDPPRKVGQPIAQLLTETISIEIAAARAQCEIRRHELAELEAGSRPEEIAQAEARLAGAKAVLEYANARFGRVKALYEQGKSASQQEFDEALSARQAAEQNYLAAQAGHKLSVQGPRHEQIDQARAKLSAAREEVRRLEDRRAKYTIRARFQGFVVAKHTEVGSWISSGDPVAEIVQLDPIEVRVSVPESYIAHVRIGAPARVRLDASPENVIVGQVSRIVPKADSRSRTFPVIVRLDNPKVDGTHLFKAGMLAHVTLGVGAQAKSLLVPKDALVLDRGNAAVVLVDSKTSPPTALVIPVQMGVAADSSIQVIDRSDRLKVGQLVVVRGNERLRTGQAVAFVRPTN